jgi:hypothetical protein
MQTTEDAEYTLEAKLGEGSAGLAWLFVSDLIDFSRYFCSVAYLMVWLLLHLSMKGHTNHYTVKAVKMRGKSGADVASVLNSEAFDEVTSEFIRTFRFAFIWKDYLWVRWVSTFYRLTAGSAPRKLRPTLAPGSF